MSDFVSYFLEWLRIEFRKFFEYKITFYFSLFGAIVGTFLDLFVLFVFKNNFSFFKYTNLQIIFFILNIYLIYEFTGILAFGKKLSKNLLMGDLNQFLIRPTSTFFQYFLYSGRMRRIYTTSLYFVAILVYLIYFDLNILKYGVVLFFSILTGFISLLFICCLDSFSFYFKKNYSGKTYRDFQSFFHSYPYSFFSDFKFNKLIFLCLPVFFYGSIITDYFFNYITFKIMFSYFSQLFLFSLIAIFILYINWKIGLKYYEGFN